MAASTELKSMGVIGCGQMGSGIAQLGSVSGLKVYLHDTDPSAIHRAVASISDNIRRLVTKNQLPPSHGDESVRRLILAEKLDDLKSVDIVIEAIVELEDVKAKLFSKLDGIVKPSAILASNTSSISITRIASSTNRPSQVIGMHFMNPPPIMKLVEIIRGADTSDDVFSQVKTLAQRLGKTVVTSQDFPGFIVNRILMPMINEAFFALYTGVASKEDIDAGMKLGTNQPMGPLQLADLIGLDVCLSIMKTLHAGFGDSKYRPCPLLVHYVHAGRLGRKRGAGVYSYDKPPSRL